MISSPTDSTGTNEGSDTLEMKIPVENKNVRYLMMYFTSFLIDLMP